MKGIKRLGLFLVAAAALFGIERWRTDGFSMGAIHRKLLDAPDAKLKAAVEIPESFSYLGKGRQMFAFDSGDLVLKVFMRDGIEIPMRGRIPILSTPSERNRWRDRSHLFLASYSLALEHLADETGVLIAHLGKSSTHFPTVSLVDHAGRRFQLDLNQVPFVLQKKGRQSFYQALQTCRDQDALAQMIERFFAFHQKRISLLIADHDRDLIHNYCWDGAELQYIDPAKFFYEPKLVDPKRRSLEWWKATHRLRKWLVANAPDQTPLFDRLSESCLYTENDS